MFSEELGSSLSLYLDEIFQYFLILMNLSSSTLYPCKVCKIIRRSFFFRIPKILLLVILRSNQHPVIRVNQQLVTIMGMFRITY